MEDNTLNLGLTLNLDIRVNDQRRAGCFEYSCKFRDLLPTKGAMPLHQGNKITNHEKGHFVNLVSIAQCPLLDPRFFFINVTVELLKFQGIIELGSSAGRQLLQAIG